MEVLQQRMRGASDAEPACQSGRCERRGFSPWMGRIPWRRKWQPTSIFLPGESHGQGGAWWAMVPRVTKSRTRLKQFGMQQKS